MSKYLLPKCAALAMMLALADGAGVTELGVGTIKKGGKMTNVFRTKPGEGELQKMKEKEERRKARLQWSRDSRKRKWEEKKLDMESLPLIWEEPERLRELTEADYAIFDEKALAAAVDAVHEEQDRQSAKWAKEDAEALKREEAERAAAAKAPVKAAVKPPVKAESPEDREKRLEQQQIREENEHFRLVMKVSELTEKVAELKREEKARRDSAESFDKKKEEEMADRVTAQIENETPSKDKLVQHQKAIMDHINDKKKRDAAEQAAQEYFQLLLAVEEKRLAQAESELEDLIRWRQRMGDPMY